MEKSKKINKKIKNEKGSITLFVLVTMFFFTIVLITSFAGLKNKMREQEKQIQKIQNEYKTIDLESAYNKAIKANE